MLITKGSTDVSVVIRIVDSTDGTPETAVEHNTAGIDLWYRREGAAVSSITEAALAALTTAHTDGGIEHISHGFYRLDVPDAAFASGVDGVQIGGTVTGMVVHAPYIQLTDVDLFDAVRGGMTALPNAAADAAGGLPISDAGGLDLDARLDVAVSSRLAPTVAARTLDVAATGEAGVDLDNTVGTLGAAQIATGALTAAKFAAGAIDAAALATDAVAEIADGVWDEAQAGHVTAGTFGIIASEIADILVDTAEIGAAGAGLTEAGGTGDHLVAIPWNASWDAEVQSEVDDALVARGLQYIVDQALPTNWTTDIAAGSALDQMADDGTATFDRTTDSLQALRDRGDAAWVTGGGGSLTQVLNVQPVLPTSIDLAGTATVRLGLILVNALDDLPTTAEITPGTISIHRKAIGGTTWSAVVTDAAMSEQAGMVYYDEVFDAGSGYAEGDSIRVTFKSVSITADANTHEVCDANGLLFQTEVRQTMRGTNSAALASVCTEARLAELDAANLPTDVAGVQSDTNDIQARLPAALVGGRMDSSTGAVAAGAIGAAGFAAGAIDAAALATDAVDEIADGVWDESLTVGQHNNANSAGRRLRSIQDFGVYDMASVWVDEVAGTSTGTTDGEDATVTNRANDFDNAQTVADSVGITSIRVTNGNSITLAAALAGYEVWGNGSTLALGGQDLAGTILRGFGDITGIATAVARQLFIEDSILGSVTLPPCTLQRVSLGGTLTVGSVGDYQLRDCASAIAGAAAPTIDLGAAVGATTISLRRWSGGLTLNNVQAGDVVSVDVVSGGTITVNGSGGTVVIRGMCNVVDGSGGAVSITQDAVVNMTKINAEADAAITDAGLATATALATVDDNVDLILADTAEMQGDLVNGGRLDLIFDQILADTNELQTADIAGLIAALNDISVADVLGGTITELAAVPGASPTLAQAIALGYMAIRNKRDTTTASDEIHNAAGTVIATATVSDDGAVFSKTNYS